MYTLSMVALAAVVSIGAFFYLTREIAAPSQDVEEGTQQLEAAGEGDAEIVFRAKLYTRT